MREYLLGLVTLPVLWLAWVGVAMLVEFVKYLGMGRGSCRWCGQVTRGRLHTRLHARMAHGLALTVGGRRRKRQWAGLTWAYAQRHGVTRAEYDATRARVRGVRP